MEEVYKTCIICGSKFVGAIQAKYCPECKYKRALDSKRKHYASKHNGTAKRVGEIFPCVMCGKPIVRKSASHKYCEECAVKRKLKEIACAGCGKIIIKQSSGQRYCERCRKLINQREHIGSEFICEVCGKSAIKRFPNQKYCDDCKKKSRTNLETTQPEIFCILCGEMIINPSPNQIYCKNCAQIKIKENAKINYKRFYEKEKERIQEVKSHTMVINSFVSDEQPLSIDVKSIFQPKFAENLKQILKTKSSAKEVSVLTGKSEKTVYGWSNKNSVPPIKILIKLYSNFGNQALPYISHKGVIRRKEEIQPSNDKPIDKLCAKAGYTVPQAAKALNKVASNFRLVYGKDNFGDNAAIELLYVFGIDDVLEYFG